MTNYDVASRPMRKLLAAMVLVLAAGCADDGPSTTAPTTTENSVSEEFNIPTCAEWVERAVTAAEVKGGCVDSESVMGTAVYECDDGSTLWWNDFGWGYVEQRAQEHQPGAEGVAPSAERESCPA